jgi:hypothetical protein
MKSRLVIIIIFSALPAAGFLLPRGELRKNEFAFQQNKRSKPARRSTNRPAANTRKDYSQFSHRSAKHKSLACDACHQAPTDNWQSASGFPDIADFPGHSSCVQCHRSEFFKGSRPAICSICHTKVSPRSEARFAFGKPNQPSQFNAIFPHDKHQDVIAGIVPNFRTDGIEAAHARVGARPVQEKSTAKYNNCAICHESESGARNASASFPDKFAPPMGTFKTTPAGHASCFDCHWKAQEPTHNNCAGCHDLSQTDLARLLAPERISLKFTHEREDHVLECTACHINITRVSTLRGLKPDVPITSCSECHKSRTDNTVATIETELAQRDRDAGFVCAKCHTSDVGKKPVPASHRAIFIE